MLAAGIIAGIGVVVTHARAVREQRDGADATRLNLSEKHYGTGSPLINSAGRVL